MIPHPRSGDYRSFFSPIYPLPLFSETIYVQINYFREDFHPFKSLILSTFILARNLVKALPRVVLLVPARISTLVHPPTPLRLLIVANFFSVDSLLEDSSIIFDLTCTKMLHNFWLKTLKKLLSINFIYLFIYFMLALGKGPLCCY
ncbi:hypothetical protein ARALYDRAFT_915860 [Arabidopsis lyrata subsp. lyrata]|uniref:Uncharacterized protein n=1 Tax=Arabidopsis lyrata subsp. lyrata TaxID=81972 RepID=D7MIB2_ARALL|nr:hypothetical protein ARALYDRAFT_915860 [Arabidopsis lyrata subsp. lyrata]